MCCKCLCLVAVVVIVVVVFLRFCCYFLRLMRWLGKYDSKVLQEEQLEMRGKEDLIMREIESNKESILKQKLKTKTILDALEKQLTKTKNIAKCISSSTYKNNED